MPPCYHQDWMGRIGWYCVVKELGRRAMGVVYHAIHPHIGRPAPDQLLATPPKTVSNDHELWKHQRIPPVRARIRRLPASQGTAPEVPITLSFRNRLSLPWHPQA